MLTAFHKQNFFAGLTCKAFGKYRAGKSRADYNNVKQIISSFNFADFPIVREIFPLLIR